MFKEKCKIGKYFKGGSKNPFILTNNSKCPQDCGSTDQRWAVMWAKIR